MLRLIRTFNASIHKVGTYCIFRNFREAFIFPKLRILKRSFTKIKPSDGEITPSFTDLGKSCPSRKFLKVANMSFNAIRENKILAKISEFTIDEGSG